MTQTRPLRCGEPSAWRSAPTPRPRRLLRSPPWATSRGASTLPGARCGAERSAGDAPPWRQAPGGAAAPVLTPAATGPAQKLLLLRVPDEFLPAALLLGFSAGHGGGSAAAAGLQWDCGVRPGSAAARRRPGSAQAAPAAAAAALRVPDAPRRSRSESERGEEAGAEGGTAGWAAPSPAPIGGHAAAHGLSLVHHPLLLPLELGGLREPAAATPAATGNANWAPASGDLCGDGRGRRKSEGRTDKRAGAGHDCDAASPAIGGGRTLYLYYIARRGAAGPRPLAAKRANRRRGGRGPGAGVGPAQRSRGGAERGGGERAGGTAQPSPRSGPAPASPSVVRGLAPASPRRPADSRGPGPAVLI